MESGSTVIEDFFVIEEILRHCCGLKLVTPWASTTPQAAHQHTRKIFESAHPCPVSDTFKGWLCKLQKITWVSKIISHIDTQIDRITYIYCHIETSIGLSVSCRYHVHRLSLSKCYIYYRIHILNSRPLGPNLAQHIILEPEKNYFFLKWCLSAYRCQCFDINPYMGLFSSDGIGGKNSNFLKMSMTRKVDSDRRKFNAKLESKYTYAYMSHCKKKFVIYFKIVPFG